MKIEINPSIVFYFFCGVAVFLLLGQLIPVLLIFFIAFILNAGLRPLVSFLESKKINRGIAISLVYFFLVISFGVLFFSIFREMINQVLLFFNDIDQKINQFILFIQNNFPFLSNFINFEDLESNVPQIVDGIRNSDWFTGILSTIGKQGISFLSGGIELVFTFFLVTVLSIYMIKSKHNFHEGFYSLLPKKYGIILRNLIVRIESNLGSWLIGMLFLMFIIAIFTYFIVLFPGFFDSNYTLGRYALIIAIIAGFLEGIPNVGPTITLVITLIIAIASGVSLAGLVYIILMFFILQQAEGLLLVPLVMKKTVDLHPIISILGVVAGFSIGGIVGGILSMPVISIIQILSIEWLTYWKRNSEKNIS